MYPTVTCDDGVVVSRDDFLDAVLRHHDFIVCPQSSVLEVLTLVVFELTCGGVKEVREYLGVLSVILHPVVENSVCRGNEAPSDVEDRDDRSVELFGFAVFVHSTQDIRDDVCFSWYVMKGKVEFLESVQPSDLAGGRFGHCLDVLQCRAVGIHDDWQPMQVMSPLCGLFHEYQEFFLVHWVIDFVFVKLS